MSGTRIWSDALSRLFLKPPILPRRFFDGGLCVPRRITGPRKEARPCDDKHAFILLACLAVCVAVALSGRSAGPRPAAYYWPHRTVGIPVNADRNRQTRQQAVRPAALLRRQSRRVPEGAEAAARRHAVARRREEGLPVHAPSATATTSSRCSSSTPTAPTSPRDRRTEPAAAHHRRHHPAAVKIYASSNGVEWRRDRRQPRPARHHAPVQVADEPRVDDGHRRAFRTSDQLRVEARSGEGAGSPRAGQRQGRERERLAGRSRAAETAPAERACREPRPRRGGPDWVGGRAAARTCPQRASTTSTRSKFDVDYTIAADGPVRREGGAPLRPARARATGSWSSGTRSNLMPERQGAVALAPVRGEGGGHLRLLRHPRERRGQEVRRPAEAATRRWCTSWWTRRRRTCRSPACRSSRAARGAARRDHLGSRRPEPDAASRSAWSGRSTPRRRSGTRSSTGWTTPTRTTGRYTWEVPDQDLWKFYIRHGRSIKRVEHRRAHLGQDRRRTKPPTEVIVDLVNPTGGIKGVRGGNTPRGSGAAHSQAAGRFGRSSAGHRSGRATAIPDLTGASPIARIPA